ncbi:hypothetical protein [Roseicyclus mahoneyensis]|jgi:hypothetical protein|uniref:Uncharacterized protein n=1 Tax=Roseicyclus mahoneyensis TaxID=164332 RepID=A0A316GM41_9RHOB|nr:hypothetical protein [Roseicyclus mahoneyensis]PWK61339.1 hypothetical protein C7455_10224 [Roseicyclus mahoneyensis]
MSRMDFLCQGGTPFDGFLYAELGEDSAGNSVTVLSALARLGLDPWDEAEALSDLSRDGAMAQLGGHLARLHDMPGLGAIGDGVLPRLIGLLPRSDVGPIGAGLKDMSRVRLRNIGPILALIVAILLLMRTLLTWSSGSGG